MSPLASRRVVVKIGTSTITTRAGTLDIPLIKRLTAEIVRLRVNGWQTVLVSSGAIQAGRNALSQRSPSAEPAVTVQTLPQKQALAAVGQPLLMAAYSRALAPHNVPAAQVLLTSDDLANRHRFTNAANTLHALLAMGALPIVNENDTVAVDEIRFGDNDTLAARVAVLIGADLVVILSDVAGLLAHPPTSRAKQTPIARVAKIDAEVEALAGGSVSGVGSGGMQTKIQAAKIAGQAGIPTRVAFGRLPAVLHKAVDSQTCGTLFEAPRLALRARKRWIAASAHALGMVVVNTGAAEAVLTRHASLLAVGVVTVEGEFSAGDIVDILDTERVHIGRGLSRFASQDLHLLKGLRSDELRARLGADCPDEVVHRDDMVL